jgi:hypothetical protein
MVSVAAVASLLFALIAPIVPAPTVEAGPPPPGTPTCMDIATNNDDYFPGAPSDCAGGDPDLMDPGNTGQEPQPWAIIPANGSVLALVVIDVDDASGNPDLTNEVNVTLTTNLGRWLDGSGAGTMTTTIGCAIDGTMSNEPELDADVDQTDTTALPSGGTATSGGTALSTGDAADNGCLFVSARLQGTGVGGNAEITASAGAAGASTIPVSLAAVDDESTDVVISSLIGGVSTHTLTTMDKVISRSITGSYVSPNTSAELTSAVRDAGGNGIAGQTVIFTTDRGTLAPFSANTADPNPLCPAGTATTPKTLVVVTGTNGLAQADLCANTETGTATVTAQALEAALNATPVTVIIAGAPQSCRLSGTGVTNLTTSAVSTQLNITVFDGLNGAGNPVADGTDVALALSGEGTGNNFFDDAPAGWADGGADANVLNDTVSGMTSWPVVSNQDPINAAVSVTGANNTIFTCTARLTGESTSTATPTGTTPAGACTVTPNSPYAAGLNAIVVQGACTAAQAAASVASGSGRTVLALWVFSAGSWRFFLPAQPTIDGGLNNFPGPVAAAFAVLG